MTNQNDPVPNVPPHFLDFQHPPGELHIDSVDDSTGDAQIVTCPGQENEVSAATAHTPSDSLLTLRSQNCAAGNSLLDTSIANHLGPYLNTISFGDKACPN